MALSLEELERRFPVWRALAELFLDTEPTAEDEARIASVLRCSSYSLAELETIWRREVIPAFGGNLLAVAGAWGAWSNEDVRTRLRPVIEGRGFGLGGAAITALLSGPLQSPWRRVRTAYAAAEDASLTHLRRLPERRAPREAE